MSHTPQPQLSPAPAGSGVRTAGVLGLLAGLFAAGVVLLYLLTGGGAESLLATAPITGHEPQIAEHPPAPTPAPKAAQPEKEAGNAAELAALEAEPADTRGRLDALSRQAAVIAQTRAQLDALSERAAAIEQTRARLEMLETEVALARAAADAASAQAEDLAQRVAKLTQGYARLGARFTPEGVLIRLDEQSFRFAPGSAELPDNADQELVAIARFLTRHPGQRALLRGHTDATGDAATNLALSEARAAAVRDALVDLGVPAAQLRVEGLGAAEPVADNITAAGRRQNRRVDILLRSPDTATGGGGRHRSMARQVARSALPRPRQEHAQPECGSG
jgi:outer membrane protein OmpA-like peptidoglycan-associated protein